MDDRLPTSPQLASLNLANLHESHHQRYVMRAPVNILAGLCLLVSAFVSPNTLANCEGGGGRLDYQLENRWRPSGSRVTRSTNFAPACRAHAKCYRQPRARQNSCDEALAEDLAAICNRFTKDTRPYGKCHAMSNEAVNYVKKRGGPRFRREQREVAREQRSAARRAARDNRRKSREARREKRRQDAYREAATVREGTSVETPQTPQ